MYLSLPISSKKPLVSFPEDHLQLEERSGIDHLYTFISERIEGKVAIVMKRWQKRVSFRFACLSLLLGGFEGAPYYPIAKAAAEGNESLGVFYGVISWIVFAPLYAWALNTASKQITKPLTVEEKALLTKMQSMQTKIFVFMLSVILGLLAVTPQAKFTYDYGHSLFYVVVIFLCDSTLPMLGASETIYAGIDKINGLFKNRIVKRAEKALGKHRQFPIKKIDTVKEALLLATPDTRYDHLEFIYEGVEVETGRPLSFQQKLKHFDRFKRNPAYPTCGKIIRVFAEFVGFITAVANLTILGYGAQGAAGQISTNPYFTHISAGCITALLAKLFIGEAMHASASRAMRLFNFVTCQPNPSLAQALAPSLSIAIELVFGTLSIFTYGSVLPLSKEYFGDNEFGKSMTALISLHLIFMVLNSVEDIVNDLVLNRFEKHGSEQQKDLIQLLNHLTRLQNIFKECPIEVVLEFNEGFIEKRKEVESKIIEIKETLIGKR